MAKKIPCNGKKADKAYVLFENPDLPVHSFKLDRIEICWLFET